MYFKRIELAGFKSFADRTVLRLEPGITGVVGPNGCGKSNVLDAIRWALGEQSAKTLRGNQMQDVIFNGSDNRHPQGMAEISLTFDNADSKLPVDFAEVQVTRRLYRSGESEYLINKTPCRLRDVQELFMDTGIGTNAYSLIGQGKIDLILSSRPEDRRFLFEEAAGIIKYKSRKRIAIRKLDAAEQNLLRLRDIIAEVQRQMRSLKRQVNAAIRYREFTDELRELEIRAAWLRFTRFAEGVTGLREKFAVAQNAYEKATAETSQLEARHEELGLSRLEADRLLLARRESVHELDGEMEQAERQIELLRQQIRFSKEQQERAAAEGKELLERAEATAAHVAEVESEIEHTRHEVDAAQGAFEAKQQEHDKATEGVATADAHLEAMRSRAVETMNDRAKAQTELETLAVSISNIESQLQALAERTEGENQRREALTATLNEAESAQAETQRELQQLEAERHEVAAAHGAKLDERAQFTDERQALRENKSSVEARLRSLRELRDAYEGFATGVRAVMRAKKEQLANVRGIIGPVGDLITTERQYERAIEAALAGNINNIIVEDAGAAKAAIAFLKAEAAGRVTFLPLDMIRVPGGESNSALDGEPGVIGPAIEHLKYDEQIRPAVEYLFRNTLLVENLDEATRIARSARSFPRLVTLDGEVVSPAGAVTGGRTKHESRGLLGRRAEIDELQDKAENAERELARLSEQIGVAEAEIGSMAERLAKLQEDEVGRRRQLNELDLALARHRTELDSLAQSAQHIDTQRDALSERRDALEGHRQEKAALADTMESDGEAVRQAVSEAQTAASSARQQLSASAAGLADVRIQVVSLKQRLEEAERNKEREKREREDILREAQRRTEAIGQLEKNQADLEREVALNVERTKALAESRDEAQKEVVEAENQRQKLLEESDVIEKKLRELREESRQTQSQVHQLELELRHNEDQIEFCQTRIRDEYSLALSSLTEEQVGADELDEDARDERIADIRVRLQRMGQVNLMAIEEFEALEKRNDFLVAQDADLAEAREALLDVIMRIDNRIRDMFMETFTKVGDYFREYFRRLFNGGQARIYLLDPDDPLESGIEIEARPPGKRPQAISLLSGGESALTAISLLFSILRAKPSPFCVLDEVDAPLDDANIGRFLDLLQEFTAQSQFVVITHSKETMARANALYGVTMQERGVSQLVSVRFEGEYDADSAA